MFEAYLVG